MSDLDHISEGEKRRILRERRLKKMEKGNASLRLNKILGQGTELKNINVNLVFDKDDKKIDDKNDFNPSNDDTVFDPLNLGSVFDNSNQNGITNTFSELLKKMGSNISDNKNDFNIDILKKNLLNESTAFPNTSEDEIKQNDIQNQIQNKNLLEYKKKVFEVKFLVVRYLLVLTNFFYSYYLLSKKQKTINNDLISNLNFEHFLLRFTAIEVIIVSTYYLLAKKNNLLELDLEKNILIKIMGFVRYVYPISNNMKNIVIKLIKYYQLFSLVYSDALFVIILLSLLNLYMY